MPDRILVAAPRVHRILDYVSGAEHTTHMGQSISTKCGYIRAIGNKDDQVTYREFLKELKSIKATKNINSASNIEVLNEVNRLIPIFQRKVHKDHQGEKSLIEINHIGCSYKIRDVFR